VVALLQCQSYSFQSPALRALAKRGNSPDPLARLVKPVNSARARSASTVVNPVVPGRTVRLINTRNPYQQMSKRCPLLAGGNKGCREETCNPNFLKVPLQPPPDGCKPRSRFSHGGLGDSATPGQLQRALLLYTKPRYSVEFFICYQSL
jgi:hypothetical protein